MSTPNPTDELLADAIALLRKMKNERQLWAGNSGFTNAHREDINDLTLRYAHLRADQLTLDGGGA